MRPVMAGPVEVAAAAIRTSFPATRNTLHVARAIRDGDANVIAADKLFDVARTRRNAGACLRRRAQLLCPPRPQGRQRHLRPATRLSVEQFDAKRRMRSAIRTRWSRRQSARTPTAAGNGSPAAHLCHCIIPRVGRRPLRSRQRNSRAWQGVIRWCSSLAAAKCTNIRKDIDALPRAPWGRRMPSLDRRHRPAPRPQRQAVER